MADERDYVIGKGKPPLHSRFKKGQSGNPNGRRKGSKNVGTLLREQLSEKIVVIENGKRKKITKLKAMLKQLVNKAVSGDHRARNQVFQLTDNDPTLATQEAEEKTQAEREAEGARNLDLFYNAVRILVELGVPLPQIKGYERPAIDTVDTEAISDRDAVEATSTPAVETASTPVEDAPPYREPLPARFDSSNSNVVLSAIREQNRAEPSSQKCDPKVR